MHAGELCGARERGIHQWRQWRSCCCGGFGAGARGAHDGAVAIVRCLGAHHRSFYSCVQPLLLGVSWRLLMCALELSHVVLTQTALCHIVGLPILSFSLSASSKVCFLDMPQYGIMRQLAGLYLAQEVA